MSTDTPTTETPTMFDIWRRWFGIQPGALAPKRLPHPSHHPASWMPSHSWRVRHQ